MAITNVNLLNAYADLSAVSYVNIVSTIPISIAGPSGSSYVEIAQQIDASTGFQARAFYNQQQLNNQVLPINQNRFFFKG